LRIVLVVVVSLVHRGIVKVWTCRRVG
jgi:hypothetical protein